MVEEKARFDLGMVKARRDLRADLAGQALSAPRRCAMESLLQLLRPLFAPAFTLWGSPASWLELIALVLSLAMVALNMRVNPLGWPLAIVSSLLYFLVFWDSRLYGEASLQIFFAIVALWGWWQWLRGTMDDGGRLRVRSPAAPRRVRLPRRAGAGSGRRWRCSCATTPIPTCPGSTPSRPPAALVGQWLLGPQYIENWATWLGVNRGSASACSPFKGLWLTVLLYAVFVLLSVIGWRAWRRGRSPMRRIHHRPARCREHRQRPRSRTSSARRWRRAVSASRWWRIPARVLRPRGPHAAHGRTTRHRRRADAPHRAGRRAARRGDRRHHRADDRGLQRPRLRRPGLYDEALAAHARADLTLLTALDLPWRADGLQRDGPHVREPVDAKVPRWRVPRWAAAVVFGEGEARLANALAAIARARVPAGSAGQAQRAAGHWVCERCGDADCERHRLSPAFALISFARPRTPCPWPTSAQVQYRQRRRRAGVPPVRRVAGAAGRLGAVRCFPTTTTSIRSAPTLVMRHTVPSELPPLDSILIARRDRRRAARSPQAGWSGRRRRVDRPRCVVAASRRRDGGARACADADGVAADGNAGCRRWRPTAGPATSVVTRCTRGRLAAVASAPIATQAHSEPVGHRAGDGGRARGHRRPRRRSVDFRRRPHPHRRPEPAKPKSVTELCGAGGLITRGGFCEHRECAKAEHAGDACACAPQEAEEGAASGSSGSDAQLSVLLPGGWLPAGAGTGRRSRPGRSGTSMPQKSQPISTRPCSARMPRSPRGPGRAACRPTRSREQLRRKRGRSHRRAARSGAGLLPRTGGAGWCRHPAPAVPRASASRRGGRCGLLREADSIVRWAPAPRLPAPSTGGLALDQQAGGDAVVGREHEARVELLDCSM